MGRLALRPLVAEQGNVNRFYAFFLLLFLFFISLFQAPCWKCILHFLKLVFVLIQLFIVIFISRRTVVNILLVCVCFLSGAAIPLAGSELIMLLGVPVLRGYFCYFPVAIGIVACLLTILKTPKNIWWVKLMNPCHLWRQGVKSSQWTYMKFKQDFIHVYSLLFHDELSVFFWSSRRTKAVLQSHL